MATFATSHPMSLPDVHTPGVGFEQPFGMLAACHERVQRSLDLLRRLLDHLQASGLDAEARAAAHDVWRYFELAAPAHHTDEERHVVPRLRASGDLWLAAVARRIEADHEALRSLWQRLGPLLHDLHQPDSTLTPDTLPTLRPLADAFIDLHARHLPLEDSMAFTRVQARMDEHELQVMGDEMAARRRTGG
jgi:hemerythrin-like domain-containing protein